MRSIKTFIINLNESLAIGLEKLFSVIHDSYEQAEGCDLTDLHGGMLNVVSVCLGLGTRSCAICVCSCLLCCVCSQQVSGIIFTRVKGLQRVFTII